VFVELPSPGTDVAQAGELLVCPLVSPSLDLMRASMDGFGIE